MIEKGFFAFSLGKVALGFLALGMVARVSGFALGARNPIILHLVFYSPLNWACLFPTADRLLQD